MCSSIAREGAQLSAECVAAVVGRQSRAHLACVHAQIFHLNGTLMIDPLSLRDYSYVVADHSSPVNIAVTFPAEAK